MDEYYSFSSSGMEDYSFISFLRASEIREIMLIKCELRESNSEANITIVNSVENMNIIKSIRLN